MVFNIYSKRQKAARDETQDVYIYNVIPEALRVQIVHIWDDSLGSKDDYYRTEQMHVREAYEIIASVLRKERGVFILPPSSKNERIDCRDEIIEYFLHEQDVDKVLDVIELSFKVIDLRVRDFHYQYKQDAEEVANQAISDLNTRYPVLEKVAKHLNP